MEKEKAINTLVIAAICDRDLGCEGCPQDGDGSCEGRPDDDAVREAVDMLKVVSLT